MSTEYSKMKKDELEDLLKARSLPHTGKKAELVARLQEYDAEQAAAAAASASSKPSSASKSKTSTAKHATAATSAEDEIDWEDDAAATSDPVGAAAIAAGGKTQPRNPTAVPNQKSATDPSKTSDLMVASDPQAISESAVKANAACTEASSKPKVEYSAGLSATDLDAELAKRKARAAKFGIQESNEDALKAIERAKRFGTGGAEDKVAVKGLDQALPERGTKRGRGREDGGGDGGRVGKRSRGRARSGTPDEKKKKKAGGASGYNDKDMAAAEARKKRFGNG